MFDPTTFVGFHTWLSLIAIVAGFPVTVGLLHGHTRPGWTGVFLSTAFATSATGFGFPFNGVLPSHIVGAIHIVLVAIASFGMKLRGAPHLGTMSWKDIYAMAQGAAGKDPEGYRTEALKLIQFASTK